MNPFRIEFGIMRYAWGKRGKDSILTSLGLLQEADADEIVAEAWAGAHPTLPSKTELGKDLAQLLQESPLEILGSSLIERFGTKLPFLFKILTVGKALSIQVHPDSQKASLLHRQFPTRYPESAQKPEIGIALSEVELLCGFRPVAEIEQFLAELGPFRHLVGELPQNSEEQFYKTLLERILLASDEDRLIASDSLVEFFQIGGTLSPEKRAFLRLQRSYAGDPGVFQCFVLQHLTLQPGDSLFIRPNTPHAYLSGELLECMAASDFVIRAGLTPKPKDISALLSVVDYVPFRKEEVLNRVHREEGRIRYLTDTEEFSIERFSGNVSVELNHSPQIFFALSGSGNVAGIPLKCPELLFVPAVSGPVPLHFTGDLVRVGIEKQKN